MTSSMMASPMPGSVKFDLPSKNRAASASLEGGMVVPLFVVVATAGCPSVTASQKSISLDAVISADHTSNASAISGIWVRRTSHPAKRRHSTTLRCAARCSGSMREAMKLLCESS